MAASLDGFIAGPHGEYDWIVMDPSIDFAAMYKEFDTAVMGRKTYEVVTAQGGHGEMPGLDVVVFSGTLSGDDAPRGPYRERRSEGSHNGAEDQTGSGHLALRRRRAVPIAARCRPRGHGGSGRHASAAGKRDSAPAARYNHETRAGRSQDAANEWHCRAFVLSGWQRRICPADSLHQNHEAPAEEEPDSRQVDEANVQEADAVCKEEGCAIEERFAHSSSALRQ